jgi:hypothetical protein
MIDSHVPLPYHPLLISFPAPRVRILPSASALHGSARRITCSRIPG